VATPYTDPKDLNLPNPQVTIGEWDGKRFRAFLQTEQTRDPESFRTVVRISDSDGVTSLIPFPVFVHIAEAFMPFARTYLDKAELIDAAADHLDGALEGVTGRGLTADQRKMAENMGYSLFAILEQDGGLLVPENSPPF
jgi:hypothetical protein